MSSSKFGQQSVFLFFFFLGGGGRFFSVAVKPRGYFHIGEFGGLGPDIKFRGKIWGKVQPSSPNKRKNLGSSVTIRHKSWERITGGNI